MIKNRKGTKEMQTYQITVKEIIETVYQIEANSIDDAFEDYLHDGVEIQSDFVRTLDETAEIREIK
jgi:hypothetical protein